MRISSFASTLLIAPLLLALGPRAEELTFHPKDDSKLTKTFAIKAELELGDVNLDISGQDLSSQVPEDASFGFEISMQIADHYIKVEGGKPLELVRQFAQFAGSYHALDESDSTDDIEDLESLEVRFKWNEDEKRYDVSSTDPEQADEDIDFLSVDMDLRSLLPGKSVSQGDRWTIDGKQLAAALIPGIDLDHLPDFEKLMEDETDPEAIQGLDVLRTEILPQFAKLKDQCRTTCEYVAQRDVDGKSIAEIKIKLDVTGSIDMQGFIRMAMEEGAGLDENDFKIDTAKLDLTVQGQGELLWDIAAGTAHGFDFSAKIEIVSKLAMTVTAEGQTVDVDGGAEFLGNGHWTMVLK